MADAINNLVFQNLSEDNLDAMLYIENDVQQSPWSAQKFVGCFSDVLYLPTGLFIHRQLVGYCIMLVNPPEAEIHNFAIDRTFQNQGLGSLFLTHMASVCSDQNIEHVYLEVRKSNYVAINVYKKAGFVPVGCRKNYYRSISRTESALVFELKLQSD